MPVSVRWSARRRGAGLAVIAVGLLAAVVIHIAAGRTVPGSAQAVPVPGPPVVGQCVGGKFDLGWDMPGADPTKYRYPELTLGPCSQVHYGEVVSIIATPTKPTVTIDSGGGGTDIDDENTPVCNQAAARFLGITGPGGDFPVLYGYWSIDTSLLVVPMTPTVRQRAVGEHWLACVTYLASPSADEQTTPVGYHGTLRSAQSTGVGRDYLGECPAEADWHQMTSSGCLLPHHGEIFGIGGLAKSVPRATLTASCTKLVAQITKSTAAGLDAYLTVAVQATDNTDNTVNGPTLPAHATVHCGLLTTRGRLLKGSLIAIGSKPIPWA